MQCNTLKMMWTNSTKGPDTMSPEGALEKWFDHHPTPPPAPAFSPPATFDDKRLCALENWFDRHPTPPPNPAFSPPASPATFDDLRPPVKMDTLLKAVHGVARVGVLAIEAKIDRYLARHTPPSPAMFERGTKRDPIALSPAGKFQRLIDAAGDN